MSRDRAMVSDRHREKSERDEKRQRDKGSVVN
jgi:hypothetical protein